LDGIFPAFCGLPANNYFFLHTFLSPAVVTLLVSCKTTSLWLIPVSWACTQN